MIRRARASSVVVIVLCGALGVISSTQTWLHVALVDGGSRDLAVPGAAAVPVLAPLSLAVLALGLALSIVGRVLRYVFAAITVLIAIALAWVAALVVFSLPTAAIAATVTEATGIAGESAVSALVAAIEPTAWPVITLTTAILLLAGGVFVLGTASTWAASGRRYRTDAPDAPASSSTSRPHDAIDSWDDLSRGEDPTARPLD